MEDESDWGDVAAVNEPDVLQFAAEKDVRVLGPFAGDANIEEEDALRIAKAMEGGGNDGHR